MKEKIIVGVIAVIVLVGAIFTAVLIKKAESNKEEENQNILADTTVTDECTIEFELLADSEDTKVVNSAEEKISTNSILILKKYYKECEHTINEYVEMPPELVNMTQEEVAKEFPEWKLIGFSPKEVTLFKEVEGSCGEHFTLKDEEGKVVIYKTLSDGSEQIYEKTEIVTEYLPLTDLLKIQSEEGIQVYGKEELNKLLEDFE